MIMTNRVDFTAHFLAVKRSGPRFPVPTAHLNPHPPTAPPHTLTCLGQQRRHAPCHEEDTADEAHLNEQHLPPLANFKYLRNYCLFGRARGVGFAPLHAWQLGRRPLFLCVLESRRNCRPVCLFTHNTTGMCSSFQGVRGADEEYWHFVYFLVVSPPVKKTLFSCWDWVAGQ